MRGLLSAAAAGSGILAGCVLLGIRNVEWTAGDLRLTVDPRGSVIRLADDSTGHDYTATVVESPLLSVQMDGVLVSPQAFSWDAVSGIATLGYSDNVTAQVRAMSKRSHLVLEVISVDPPDGIELVVWGPYATTIADTIGETVGVVRNEQFAIGIQALNPKTLGGFPWRENDFPPQIDIFESGDYSDLSEEGKRHVLYRVEAAKPESYGSTLQAYCRNRSHERIIANWGHDSYTTLPFDDGGVVGCKIALFGSSTARALETIGRIEVAESLPHPTIDGEWGKVARTASAAYMILDFGEEDIDDALN